MKHIIILLSALIVGCVDCNYVDRRLEGFEECRQDESCLLTANEYNYYLGLEKVHERNCQ